MVSCTNISAFRILCQMVIFLFLSTTENLFAQKIHKFEHLNIPEGLSQNLVQSMLCDDKGFLWFGTWDGLIRYDGENFRKFKVNPDLENSLTNNRIADLWQDKQHKIWIKTGDSYVHYFVEETYEFITYPNYLNSLEKKTSIVTCFTETDQKEIFLGTTNSGLYYLKHDDLSKRYIDRQFKSGAPTNLSNNSISFVTIDELGDIWVGTNRGLNHVSKKELTNNIPEFSVYQPNDKFTVGFSLDSILLVGTERDGIKLINIENHIYDDKPEIFKDLSGRTITLIQKPLPGKLLVGTKSAGLYVYDLNEKSLQTQLFKGKEIKKVYCDSYQTLWVNTPEFGIYRVDPTFQNTKHFDLVPPETQNIVDDERQFIYEDLKNNLWIGLHFGGLAYYNRQADEFHFYRHTPNDNTTISSDIVYCMTEDKSGLLWVGTGQPNGGINKIYTTSEAFKLIQLEKQDITDNENVVRSILVDKNGYTWVGTKMGNIYILDQDYQSIKKFHKIPLVNGFHPGQNTYTMMLDKDGFIWIGTKGAGVFVSELSINSPKFKYENLRFIHYFHDVKDSLSLSSNIIYSIFQDSNDRIWIGSIGGGLNLVTNRNGSNLNCLRFNDGNSGLSSNSVRYIMEDHTQKLWVATSFGLNFLDLNFSSVNNIKIKQHLFDPRRASSLSYNDVIHVFEDSKDRLWIGTSGGGVNKLKSIEHDSLYFTYLDKSNGLINDVVFGIIEDDAGSIWFSTDNGLSKYDAEEKFFENFDQRNNLSFDAFNENTCGKSLDGKLLFGSNDGLVVVTPGLIKKDSFEPYVALTNFQLFNKDIDIWDPNSPIKQDIETLDEIELTYSQSSFSIEYAALSFFAPTKNRYSFKLENFDDNWNEVGNQNKATYTNLAPGKYIFNVKAANWNGNWSDQTRSISITILPPWWKTNIMYLLYAILLIIIFETIRRSYVRYYKMQNDLQVEKRVSDIKLQFFTNISHEIRTPLTLILGPIHDIMEMKSIPKNILNKLSLVEKNGKRMLRLVNQLLDFRKIQMKKMDLKVQRTELVSFIRLIIENFELIASHKKVEIVFNTDIEAVDVWVDPNKFDSVIFNVVSNALKFSPKASLVTIAVDSHSADYIDIVISDQGSGIPKDKMNLLFQRFSPLSEENEEFGSSGIGLAFSYQIMKLHHGDIMVNSELDMGSTFIIRLLSGSEHFNHEEILSDETESLYVHEKVIEDEEDVKEIQVSEHNVKENYVLVVEDNSQILNYLKENLQKKYHVSIATNGQEALSSIQIKQPDVVITDIMMPIMNGIELTKHLKNSFETSHIPVIMLTAKSTIDDQVEGVESGAEAYVLKPFNMAYIHAVIDNLIKQRRLIYLKYVQERDNGGLDLKITNKDEKFLNDVTNLIMQNYSDPEFNIDKLAESSYVSRTVFYHKIKSLTGLTPINFLRQKRLEIASKLIIETDYNVSEIALITGFNDTKNFSKRFKEIYKLTPSQYKQEMLSEKS